jgi:hypothetical protein
MPPAGDPPAPYATWCDWAWDNYRKALEGFTSSSSGTEGYGIGSRWVRYRSASDQAVAVDQWRKMVEDCCGITPPGGSMTGQECAVRAIPRDV